MSNLIDRDWIGDALRYDARLRERQIARAILRGDKLYTEPRWFGGSLDWDLTTRWWQLLKRRKMIRMAQAELKKEDT